MSKRGQISVEYMIVVGFIVFVVIGIIGTALLYASSVRDMIKSHQVSAFAEKISNSAESVYYAGQPSQVTIHSYLPEGVREVKIVNDNSEYSINFIYVSSSGQENIAYPVSVPIVNTTSLSYNSGLKRFLIRAEDGFVSLSES